MLPQPLDSGFRRNDGWGTEVAVGWVAGVMGRRV